MRILLLLALSSALVGCASAPTPPAEQPVAAAAPAPEAAPAPSTSAPVDAAKSTQSDEWKPPAGYRSKVENGQTVYCKKVTVLGSRFPKDLCMTESQVRDLETTNDNVRRDKDQSSRICTMGGCGSN